MKHHSRSGARHKSRMRAVELVFEADARNVPYGEIIAQRNLVAGQDDTVRPVGEYAQYLVQLVDLHHERIDALITDKLRDWQLYRLPGVDRAILRVAVAEMGYCPDIAHTIAIDEAVKIAKELSTDDSPHFINGILNTVSSYCPLENSQ